MVNLLLILLGALLIMLAYADQIDVFFSVLSGKDTKK